MMVQVGMVCFFGLMLVAAVRMRNSGKQIGVSSVAQVKLTPQQRRALKRKARACRRQISWAERRLVKYPGRCRAKTRRYAWRILKGAASNGSPSERARSMSIIGELAAKEDDVWFVKRANKFLGRKAPLRAKMIQRRVAATYQAPSIMPKAA